MATGIGSLSQRRAFENEGSLSGTPHEALFSDNHAEWRERVRVYMEERGAPENVPRWQLAEDNGEQFRELFNKASKRSVSGRFIHGLKKHELPLCPACGSPGRPNIRDHYLPEAHWPHFAATPANLYPMCSTCQGSKGSRTGNPRYFIHPYFDRFSIPQIITLTILPPFEVPLFELNPSNDLTAPERQLVTSHIDKLKIEERFVTFFRADHRRLLRLARTLRDSGVDVGPTLNGLALSSAFPTVNGWQHLFYSTVVQTKELMEYLRNGDLPDLL